MTSGLLIACGDGGRGGDGKAMITCCADGPGVDNDGNGATLVYSVSL